MFWIRKKIFGNSIWINFFQKIWNRPLSAGIGRFFSAWIAIVQEIQLTLQNKPNLVTSEPKIFFFKKWSTFKFCGWFGREIIFPDNIRPCWSTWIQFCNFRRKNSMVQGFFYKKIILDKFFVFNSKNFFRQLNLDNCFSKIFQSASIGHYRPLVLSWTFNFTSTTP